MESLIVVMMRRRNGFLFGLLATAVFALLPVWAGGELKALADIQRLEQKVERMASRVRPAVVALISEKTQATGSGVVASEDGLILTAAHVIQGARQLEVVFPDGKQVKGKVLGANYSKDVAMVRIIGGGKWPHADIGSSKELKAGAWVVAMGHSSGYDSSRPPPVRFGQVISTGPGTFLTSDCALIGGDSGGPIFDLDGKIIGINSSIGESLKNNNHSGIQGFLEDWDRLLDGQTWGQLSLNPFSNPETPVLGIEMGYLRGMKGVGVVSVIQGSPAAAAGVRPGDVIRTLNGEEIDDAAELLQLLAKLTGGDEVKLGLARENEALEVSVVLKKYCELYRKGPRPVPIDLVGGDEEVPLMRPEEREAVDAQQERFTTLLTPMIQPASKSTVRVWKGSERNFRSYGTVIDDGSRVLTKWSEVMLGSGAMVIDDGAGQLIDASIERVYPDEDLAVLKLAKGKLTPVLWKESPMELGSFLVAAQPTGVMAGFGVLAVEERSLRDSDKGFLGVVGDSRFAGPGVKVGMVADESAAAAAGVKEGDIILEIGKRPVSGVVEMRSVLVKLDPGTRVELKLKRGEEVITLDAVLGHRPEEGGMFNPRQSKMEKMGTAINQVRDRFPAAIQTDMNIQPRQMGGPVINLKGEVVGIMLARADRTRSFLLSSEKVQGLLKEPGKDPEEAKIALLEQREESLRQRVAQQQELRKRVPRGEQIPRRQISPERLQAHLDEMRRLMEYLQRELDDVEGR